VAEPGITLRINTGTEGTPSWAAIDTAIRWVGPDASAGDLTDPFVAPVLDATDAFFDASTSPNDGELWHDTTTDAQVTVAGRNSNRNTLEALEGGTDATSDPPEFTAFDDATDAGNRTNPTTWLLVGTSGTSNVSCLRAGETTSASVGGDWNTHGHASAPSAGNPLDGDQTSEKVTCSTVLAQSGSKTFQLAACAPHDSTAGLTTFVYAFMYTYQ
jgi:hypothetical protein